MKKINDLILGTAQFGMDYGVTNSFGKISDKGLEDIMSIAHSNNVRTLDMASTYGDAEVRMGKFLRDHSLTGDFKFVTKVFVNSNDQDSLSSLTQQLESTLEKMNGVFCDGIMFHSSAQIMHSNGLELYSHFNEFAKSCGISKVGCSFYDLNDFVLLHGQLCFDLIQVPFNIFNQSFFSDSSVWGNNKPEIHLRSVFLQGILLKTLNQLPKYFQNWEQEFRRYEDLVASSSLNKIAFNLSVAASLKEADKLVIGITSSEELTEIITCFNSIINNTTLIPKDLACEDQNLTNPSLWDLKTL